MIPLRDINPSHTRPVITILLILANALVWLMEVRVEASEGPQGFGELLTEWGLVPERFLSGSGQTWVTPLTSMFMHGSWAHVLSNLWFLWIFGDNVEDALGKGRYLFFYLACGLGAVASHMVVDPESSVPMVGASGAIAGVIGAYVVLYPRARIVTLAPLPLIFLIELPAFFFIFLWFGIQVVSGYLTQAGVSMGPVAFFAHIGGFAAGLLLILLLPRRRGLRRRFSRRT